METATREYTAPFFSTVNNWLVGRKTAGSPGMRSLMFSSRIISKSSTEMEISAAKLPLLFVFCFSISGTSLNLIRGLFAERVRLACRSG